MFSRRLFPGLILIGTLLLAKAADTRPSILYCLADDWSWPHACVYGDPVVRTPTFHPAWLAREFCSIIVSVRLRPARRPEPRC